jgi:phage terminase small subunit
MKGRPKTPAALKILRGTYRKGRDGPPPDQAVPAGKPTPPDFLGGEALAFWKSIVPGMVERRVVEAVDSTMLGLLCWFHAEAVRHMRLLDAEKDHACTRARRLLAAAAAATERFDKIACRFGMTPADRAKLSPPPVCAGGISARKRD